MAHVHRVAQGECIASIAFRNGFFPDDLWNHPRNAALKEERGDPYVLLPGDEVFIPDRKQRPASCATGRRHVFRRRGVPQRFTLTLLLEDQPRANLPYVLDVGQTRFSGTTGADGTLSHWIPPDAERGLLRLSDVEAYEVRLGGLDPASTRSGFLSRLESLGFLDPDEYHDERACEDAIIEFKRRHAGLCWPEEEVDDAQRKELAALTPEACAAMLREHGS